MMIFKFIEKSVFKTFSKENVFNLFEIIKNKIIEQARYELAGTEKKTNVDNAVIGFIKTNMKTANPIVNVLINILVEYIPILTQCIYEYLKKYVDGLTEA